MSYEWLDEYILAKPAAKKIYQPLWEAYQYKVDKKIFALKHLHKNGREVVSLKLYPEFSDMVRLEHKDVIVGYHMNKRWWVSVYLDGKTPDDVFKEMIDQSYFLIFDALPKKLQADILSGTKKDR